MLEAGRAGLHASQKLSGRLLTIVSANRTALSWMARVSWSKASVDSTFTW
jgi:hypothetical protein